MADNQGEIVKSYPISVFRYKATIGDDEIFFSEISGLNLSYETTEYKEAGSTGVTTIQVSGQRKAPEITMKRGLFKNGLELYEWFNATHTDDYTKKEVVISLLDNNNNAIMTWTVANCLPMKFDGPGLNATSNDVSFQTITLKGDSIVIANA